MVRLMYQMYGELSRLVHVPLIEPALARRAAF